ncbi:MAG: DUF2254 domain-containing protein [Reyranellaceae bacterium]
MLSRWQWLLIRTTRRLWFRATLFSVLGIVVAVLAALVQPLIPADIPAKIGADSVDNILGIIASSMLAVTTFSLSTMVASYAAATSNVTPRATSLLIEDPTTQNALATFIGSFLFSLVGIIALSTGIYGSQGRVVLFAATLLVIAAVVVMLLRWIDHLARLGRVGETTERVEQAAARAMRERRRWPTLGAVERRGDPPAGAQPVHAATIGYVQHIDIGALSEAAGEGRVHVEALPGGFVDRTRPLAYAAQVDQDRLEAVREAFTVASSRSFEQDPRFGLSVMAEIASRALSPALNDPGTAIDVIGRSVRILSILLEKVDDPDRFEVEIENVFVPTLAVEDMFDDMFTPIARDGAGNVEVQLRLQKALASLAGMGDERFAAAARRHSREARERAETAMTLEADRERVRAVAIG